MNENKAYQYCCSNPLDKHHWLKQYIAGLVELHISSNHQIVLSKTLETKKTRAWLKSIIRRWFLLKHTQQACWLGGPFDFSKALNQHYSANTIKALMFHTGFVRPFFQKYYDFEYYHQRVKADGAACPVPKFLLGWSRAASFFNPPAATRTLFCDPLTATHVLQQLAVELRRRLNCQPK